MIDRISSFRSRSSNVFVMPKEEVGCEVVRFGDEERDGDGPREEFRWRRGSRPFVIGSETVRDSWFGLITSETLTARGWPGAKDGGGLTGDEAFWGDVMEFYIR